MMLAAQARRRASAAVIWPPVSRVATPAAFRSASSWSNVMMTTMVVEQPPGLGEGLGGDGFEQLAERDTVAHRIGQAVVGVGVSGG